MEILDSQEAGGARLHYFAGRGRAETTRWMLAACRIAFETHAIVTSEDFAALKASGKLMFGQLPLLEIDGFNLTQTGAMIRYLARLGDLYGDGPVEAVTCDMVAGAVVDFSEPAITFAFQKSHAAGVEGLSAALSKYGVHLERILAENGGEHIVGTRLSFADVMLAESLTAYLERDAGILQEFPSLARLQENVIRHPGISDYLASANRWPVPGDEYVIDVARVLTRSLPPHMPDPDRFVAAP